MSNSPCRPLSNCPLKLFYRGEDNSGGVASLLAYRNTPDADSVLAQRTHRSLYLVVKYWTCGCEMGWCCDLRFGGKRSIH